MSFAAAIPFKYDGLMIPNGLVSPTRHMSKLGPIFDIFSSQTVIYFDIFTSQTVIYIDTVFGIQYPHISRWFLSIFVSRIAANMAADKICIFTFETSFLRTASIQPWFRPRKLCSLNGLQYSHYIPLKTSVCQYFEGTFCNQHLLDPCSNLMKFLSKITPIQP